MFDTRRQKIVHKGLAIVTVKWRQTASGQRGCNASKGKNEAGKGNGLPAVAGIPFPYASTGENGLNRGPGGFRRYISCPFPGHPDTPPRVLLPAPARTVLAEDLTGFGREEGLPAVFAEAERYILLCLPCDGTPGLHVRISGQNVAVEILAESGVGCSVAGAVAPDAEAVVVVRAFAVGQLHA